MKRVGIFLRRYRHFSFTLGATTASLALTLNGLGSYAHWLLAAAALLGAILLFWDMLKDIRLGTYGIDILAITAIVTAVVLKEYWAAIIVVLMLTGGESLEDYAEHRARAELDSLLDNAPHKATVIRKGKRVSVNVENIKVGDKIVVKVGEVVPVDSVVIEGASSFDESSLTGESVPQTKDVNDALLSGSINLEGVVTVKATATAENSQYQQIIKLVQGANANQAPYVRLAERYSIPFTIISYMIAVSVWVISGDPHRFLEVIIVATPCPLLLAAPIAMISGMSRASKHGVIIKTGSALEKLAELKTLAFDKTGTLTQGILKVEKVEAFHGHKKDDVLALAASLEMNSNHVVAAAIVEAANDKKIKLTKAKHVKEIAGKGVSAQLKGKTIVLGRYSLLEENDVVMPPAFKHSSVKQTAVFLAVNGELAGTITFADEIRENAKSTLQNLRQHGIKNFLMVTGDNSSTANKIAASLGIDKVHAEALPAEKLHIIESIPKKDRYVGFVGDGVNDAPVLASADLGIALGARGSAAASESADVVIMLDDISRVAAARSIADRTFKIATQSIFVGMGLSLILMGIFATGKFTPIAGALLQEVVDVVVIINALRAHLDPKDL